MAFFNQRKYPISIFLATLWLASIWLHNSQAASPSVQASPYSINPSDDEEKAEYTTFLPIISIPKADNVMGMQMQPLSESGGLNQLAETKTSWVGGIPVHWADVEAVRGVYDWSIPDANAPRWVEASSKGFNILGNIRTTPTWAQLYPGYFCGPMQAQYFDEFAEFVYQVVSRYSVPPYNVKYWEIWNEPDVDHNLSGPQIHFGCWGDPNDPFYGGGYFAEMLKIIYPAVKRANPEAKVLVGGLALDCSPDKENRSCLSSKYFEGILRYGGGDYFDGVNFHSYDSFSYTWGAPYEDNLGKYHNNTNWNSQWNVNGPVLIEKANYLKSLMNQYGVSGKELINNEFALNCSVCNGEPVQPYNEDPTPAFETTKAYYITQAYAAAINLELKANLWYCLLGWPEKNTELMNSDLSEREGFTAYRIVSQKLAEVKNQGELTYTDVSSMIGLKGYKFSHGQKEIWVVWSLDGEDHTVDLTYNRTLTSITDALGNPQPASSPITITIKPIYIEWE